MTAVRTIRERAGAAWSGVARTWAAWRAARLFTRSKRLSMHGIDLWLRATRLDRFARTGTWTPKP